MQSIRGTFDKAAAVLIVGLIVCIGWAVVPLVLMSCAYALGPPLYTPAVLSASGIVWIACALSYTQVLNAF